VATSAIVQVFIDDHHKRCAAALQRIALLADTMSQEHYETFDTGPGQPLVNGWRVAEKMREIANDVIGSLELTGG